MNNINKILPIGSIVKIEKNKSKIMIVGYLPKANKKTYLYAGILYPYGLFDFDNYICFNNNIITDTIFKGYDDINYKAFEKGLIAGINKKDINEIF